MPYVVFTLDSNLDRGQELENKWVVWYCMEAFPLELGHGRDLLSTIVLVPASVPILVPMCHVETPMAIISPLPFMAMHPINVTLIEFFTR